MSPESPPRAPGGCLVSAQDHSGAGRGRWAVWVAGLLVAVGAAATTAHGLFEVALAAGTPVGIGWLYPVITDGLALVAYASTTRLPGRACRYAWAVVVLAAGLSGLAQASYLAGGVASAGPALRFGVGAWPAVAAAIAAHLLYLIGTSGRAAHGVGGVTASAEPVRSAVAEPQRSEHGAGELPAREPRRLSPAPVGDRVERTPPVQVVRPAGDRVVRVQGVPTCTPAGVQVVRTEGVQPDHDADRSERQGVLRTALSPRDRAFALAELWRRRHACLPSVRELAGQSEVSLGTAASVLRELRERPPELQVLDNEATSTDTTTTP